MGRRPRRSSRGRRRARRLTVLGDVADTDDRAAELVGESVQAADRVADEPFLVGVDAAEVVADRVDDEQADLTDLVGELRSRDVAGRKLSVTNVPAGELGVGCDEPRLECRSPSSLRRRRS